LILARSLKASTDCAVLSSTDGWRQGGSAGFFLRLATLLMVKRYGDDAMLEAAGRADQLQEAGGHGRRGTGS
jgi:hypothetical protein